MTTKLHRTIASHRDELERDGYLYCFDCGDWFDDTLCYPGDHSRHCGHHMKPALLTTAEVDVFAPMRPVMVCTAEKEPQ